MNGWKEKVDWLVGEREEWKVWCVCVWMGGMCRWRGKVDCLVGGFQSLVAV